MFAEEFNKMIGDPASIAEISLGDIRVIAERYPYCQAASILLARKLQLSDSPLFEQHLKKAAIMAYDREQLYKLLHSPIPEPAHADEHFEESPAEQPITTLQEETRTEQTHAEPEVWQKEPTEEPVSIKTEELTGEIVEPVVEEPSGQKEDEEADAILQEMINSIPEISAAEEEVVTDHVFSAEEGKIEAMAMLEEENTLEVLENSVPPEPEAIKEVEPESEPEPEPTFEQEVIEVEDDFIFDRPAYNIERELGTLDEEDMFTIPAIPPEVIAEENTEVFMDTFEGWLQRLSGRGSGRIVEQKAANAPVRVYLRKQPSAHQDPAEHAADKLMNEHIAADLARKSIQSDAGLVSETYARILVMQGKYAKAMEMYQKLSLLKPQKSNYFAALIEQLKKR